MSAIAQGLSVAAARDVLSRGSKSFSFAAVFLPRDCRDDAARVYAFCRAVDDLVDERTSDQAALVALARLEDELHGRVVASAVTAAYLEVAFARNIGIEPALELIEGVRSDIGPVAIEDDGQLLRYCYRVAGTVGLMMSGVIGVRDRAAAPFAIDLGIAMQLTNICRDVLEDAELGRVYLPARRLEATDLSAGQLLDGTIERDTVRRVTRELLELAEQYYSSAAEGLHFIPRRPRFAILLAARIYRSIGRKLLRRGGDPLRGRTVVSTGEKLLTLFGSLGALFGPAYWGLRTPALHETALHRRLRGLPGIHAGSQGAEG